MPALYTAHGAGARAHAERRVGRHGADRGRARTRRFTKTFENKEKRKIKENDTVSRNSIGRLLNDIATNVLVQLRVPRVEDSPHVLVVRERQRGVVLLFARRRRVG